MLREDRTGLDRRRNGVAKIQSANGQAEWTGNTRLSVWSVYATITVIINAQADKARHFKREVER